MGARDPDVADHLARRSRRRPAREDHVDCAAWSSRAASRTSPPRQLQHLQDHDRYGNSRSSTTTSRYSANEVRSSAGARPGGVGAYELDHRVAGELLQHPALRHALGRTARLWSAMRTRSRPGRRDTAPCRRRRQSALRRGRGGRGRLANRGRDAGLWSRIPAPPGAAGRRNREPEPEARGCGVSGAPWAASGGRGRRAERQRSASLEAERVAHRLGR